jgi:hypothetical protein
VLRHTCAWVSSGSRSDEIYPRVTSAHGILYKPRRHVDACLVDRIRERPVPLLSHSWSASNLAQDSHFAVFADGIGYPVGRKRLRRSGQSAGNLGGALSYVGTGK